MNEVLRRKLFNKVMNANQPAGILASSPEMVETVQRRASGGSYKAPTSNILSNALRSIRGLPTIRQAGNTSGAGMPEFTGTSGGTSMQRQAQMGDAIFGGIDTPEYLRFVESIKGLPYAQQVKAMQEAGYGATIGTGPIQPVLDAAQSVNQGVVDVVKGIGSLGEYAISDEAADDLKASSFGQAMKKVGDTVLGTGPGSISAAASDARRKIQQQRINKRTDAAILAEDDDQTAMTPIVVPTPMGEDNVDDDFIGGVGTGILSDQLPTGLGNYGDEFGNLLGGIDGRSVPTSSAAAPVIAAAEKEVAESTEPQATASNISTTFDKLTANLNSILGGGKATEKINPQQAEKTSTHAALAAKIAEGPTAVEDVDLDKIEELVSETTGFDPEKSGEAKKGAFWNAVITAGLSIAAGESGNNLTNIAKGLGFAFNQYGKAVGELTAQDRADQKEARVLRLNLIKDEKTANIAKAAKQDQYNQQVFQNDLALKQDGDTVAHRDRLTRIETAKIFSGIEVDLIKEMNTKAYRDAAVSVQRDTLNASIAKNLAEMTPDSVKLMQAQGQVITVDGKLQLTPEAEAIYGADALSDLAASMGAKETALASTDKSTDTTRLSAAIRNATEAIQRGDPVAVQDMADITASNLSKSADAPEITTELLTYLANISAGGGQQSGSGQGSIPEYNTQPSDEELGKLLQSGVTQIKIGGKTYPIQKN